ncbi:VMAP-C domain-containing protein [Streptomyces flavalbus]|uniref:Uncharacterized protein n=1 Tax=Streptomyces flavalbus TaxID=2665155 RepID=A0ABW2WB42_9ACTN
MVDALGTSTALADPRGRLQWARELAAEFEGLELTGFPTPRQEFVEAVRLCSRTEGGLDGLVDITEFLAPALSTRLRPLLDEWYATDLYEGRDWTALRAGLDFSLPELPTLIAEISGDRVRLPAYCTSVWHAFVHLAGHNAPVGGLEPSMVLLEHLMLRAEAADLVGEIRAWNDHFAAAWGTAGGPSGLRALRSRLAARHRPHPALTADPAHTGHRALTVDPLHTGHPALTVDPAHTGHPAHTMDKKQHTAQLIPATATSAAAPPATVPPPRAAEVAAEPDGETDARPAPPVIRMFIKVAPDLTPFDATGPRRRRPEPRYRISSRVRYVESTRLHQEGRDPQDPVPRGKVPTAVAELLSATAELWQARDENVVLEIFLPTELLAEPVEWWDRNPQLSHPNPLLSKYPSVFIHSLERMQRRDLHHVWRRRWTRWRSDPGSGQAHWCDPQGRPAAEHLELLDARIGKEEGVVCMVLSDTPRTRSGLGPRELRVGLDHGVPVLVFHREAAASEAFRSLVQELLAGQGLANLPETARQWRGDAAAGAAGQRDKTLIRHLGVIWDDPHHLLDGDACAPAAFIGGTD